MGTSRSNDSGPAAAETVLRTHIGGRGELHPPTEPRNRLHPFGLGSGRPPLALDTQDREAVRCLGSLVGRGVAWFPNVVDTDDVGGDPDAVRVVVAGVDADDVLAGVHVDSDPIS